MPTTDISDVIDRGDFEITANAATQGLKHLSEQRRILTRALQLICRNSLD